MITVTAPSRPHTQFDEHVYIALSKEGDSEEVLTKKLLVFNRIVTLLYGPVHNKYVFQYRHS